MKLKALLICLSLLTPSITSASSWYNTDGFKGVTHFQLLVNNLNISYMINAEKNAIKTYPNDSSIKFDFIRFSSPKDGQIAINTYYSAPAEKITENQCKEIANYLSGNLKDEEFVLKKILPGLTVKTMTPAQAEQIISETSVKVHLITENNPLLNISCQIKK